MCACLLVYATLRAHPPVHVRVWVRLPVHAALVWVTSWVFALSRKPVSLHWTVKCSNLLSLGPNGSWVSAEIAAGLWYMGFPALTLWSPILLRVVTGVPTLSPQEIEKALSQRRWEECGLKKLFSSHQNQIFSMRACSAALHAFSVLGFYEVLLLGSLPPFLIVHGFFFFSGTEAFRFPCVFVLLPWF